MPGGGGPRAGRRHVTFVQAAGDPVVADYTCDPVRNSVTFLDYVPPTSATVNLSYIVAYD